MAIPVAETYIDIVGVTVTIYSWAHKNPYYKDHSSTIHEMKVVIQSDTYCEVNLYRSEHSVSYDAVSQMCGRAIDSDQKIQIVIKFVTFINI